MQPIVHTLRITDQGLPALSAASAPALGERRVFEVRGGLKMDFVWIPPGEFDMGDGKDADCPKHTVHLDGYWMGVHCVTNREYWAFVKATGHRAPDTADGGDPVWKNGTCPDPEMNHPVVCVSWDDAKAFADWAGLALATEAQWEKAARGPKGLIYPWDNEWDATRCRHSGNRGSETTAEVRAYPSGVSGYGTYQQAGNVWEWCADRYGGDYYGKRPARNPTGPETGSSRVGRGGCWGRGGPSRFRGGAATTGAPPTALSFWAFAS